MDVDNRRELTFQASLGAADLDPLQVKSTDLLRAGNPQKADIGGAARIADNPAMAYSACTYKGEPRRYVVELWMQNPPTDVDERRKDLTRFIAAYLPPQPRRARPHHHHAALRRNDDDPHGQPGRTVQARARPRAVEPSTVRLLTAVTLEQPTEPLKPMGLPPGGNPIKMA
ncbi:MULTISPECIES: hypothetical protein [unclassified Streptomyces]|uniref:hypothetical protein n=1 Tax=unclassified Streptomyces TaxID=2593676 RepID=UPI003327F639